MPLGPGLAEPKWSFVRPLMPLNSLPMAREITPGDWERIHGLRLQFVYRPNGPSLLVANNARLTARGRAVAFAEQIAHPQVSLDGPGIGTTPWRMYHHWHQGSKVCGPD